MIAAIVAITLCAGMMMLAPIVLGVLAVLIALYVLPWFIPLAVVMYVISRVRGPQKDQLDPPR